MRRSSAVDGCAATRALRFDYASGPFFTTYVREAGGGWTVRLEAGRPDGTRRLFATKHLRPAPDREHVTNSVERPW